MKKQSKLRVLLRMIKLVKPLTGFMLLAVLMGTGMMWLVYIGIDAGISQVIKDYDIALGNYMPDQLLNADSPKAIRAILSSLITGGVFLPLAVRIFDKRDVK